ncbi:hypothetical protein L345_04825, partial [Ophiophagus hannah]
MQAQEFWELKSTSHKGGIVPHLCVADVAKSDDVLGEPEDVNENDGVGAGDEDEDENGVLGVDADGGMGDGVEGSGVDVDVSAYDGGLVGLRLRCWAYQLESWKPRFEPEHHATGELSSLPQLLPT